MLLILSARRVGEDIAVQYGGLPPSFLPLGNQRLFAYQAELADGGPVAMTVPADYEISPIDRAALDRLGVKLLPQDPKLSLNGAIKDAIDRAEPQGPLQLLYGDTLVRLPEDAPKADLIAVHETNANYQWAYLTPEGGFSDTPPQRLDARQVICGYYVFEDPALLARACDEPGIVAALNAYHGVRPLASVEAQDWFDFGHLPLLYQSKKSILVRRVFNEIAYENHMLVKQSEDTAKIRAEANWYEHLPEDIQIHTPRYRGRIERNHRSGYAVEYLYHPLLSDLAAFGALPLTAWLEILTASFEFADKCQAIRPDHGAPEASPEFAARFFDELMVTKTWDRLSAYAEISGVSLEDRFTINKASFPALREVIEQLIAAVPPTRPDHVRFWHGDMFYGNMFYDFTARRIIAIDPRGQTASGNLCLYGDWRYDIAKLAHSVIGQYDKIILGRAVLEEGGSRNWMLEFAEQPHQRQIEEIFLSQVAARYGLARDELLAMTALLFFSMLPLHSDRPDLQKQMLANGLRLAAQIDGIF